MAININLFSYSYFIFHFFSCQVLRHQRQTLSETEWAHVGQRVRPILIVLFNNELFTQAECFKFKTFVAGRLVQADGIEHAYYMNAMQSVLGTIGTSPLKLSSLVCMVQACQSIWRASWCLIMISASSRSWMSSSWFLRLDFRTADKFCLSELYPSVVLF